MRGRWGQRAGCFWAVINSDTRSLYCDTDSRLTRCPWIQAPTIISSSNFHAWCGGKMVPFDEMRVEKPDWHRRCSTTD